MKKPMFKSRVMMADEHGNTYQKGEDPSDKTRVRVTDSRDITPEKAVEKVFSNMADLYTVTSEGLNRFLVGTPFVATMENGRPRVRRAKR